ncbi:MAG: hypothetical protein KC656_21755, partial [Myxococcales bacterium]|nr:hypothetical protein [Myxococcales bacterium]
MIAMLAVGFAQTVVRVPTDIATVTDALATNARVIEVEGSLHEDVFIERSVVVRGVGGATIHTVGGWRVRHEDVTLEGLEMVGGSDVQRMILVSEVVSGPVYLRDLSIHGQVSDVAVFIEGGPVLMERVDI